MIFYNENIFSIKNILEFCKNSYYMNKKDAGLAYIACILFILNF